MDVLLKCDEWIFQMVNDWAISDYSNIYQHIQKMSCITEVPYFNNDFWPDLLEGHLSKVCFRQAFCLWRLQSTVPCGMSVICATYRAVDHMYSKVLRCDEVSSHH